MIDDDADLMASLARARRVAAVVKSRHDADSDTEMGDGPSKQTDAAANDDLADMGAKRALGLLQHSVAAANMVKSEVSYMWRCCVFVSSQRMCMRSKAWLAASVSLRLARLRSTLAAAPGLLAHALVTKQ